MEPSPNSQPRDSRLDNFSATASHIIFIERGLTSTALKKIKHLAMKQHLSEEQVIECLDRIAHESSTLGRVGRYEQIFLDRMTKNLKHHSGSVLSPQTSQEAIRLATDEYQISVTRAQQLLDHAVKERGLQQISAADAQNQIRTLIADKFVSSKRPRENFENELISYAADFGISAEEVGILIDEEIKTQNQQKVGLRRRLTMVAATILTALCVAGASYLIWPISQTSPMFSESPTEPIVESPIINAKDAETNPSSQKTGRSQNEVKNLAKELPLPDTEASNFNSGEFVAMVNRTTILKFARWREQFVELASQNFEQRPNDASQSLSADRQRKRDAIEILKSELSEVRIQIRALEDLSSAAKRIEDITPEEAKTIAEFCFQEHNTLLESSILRTVKKFGRWPHFLLAVSDMFAINRPPSSSDKVLDNRQRRLVLAITDGKLKNNDDISASLFAMARLRIKERLIATQQAQEVQSTHFERFFISYLRQFIASQMNDRGHQSYFNQLIDARDLDLPSMQRQIELYQILIEALLFAKPDDESLAAGELHFRSLKSAATLGAQLSQSRKTSLRLVDLHSDWLTRDAGDTRQTNLDEFPDTGKATHLRDRAEEAVISGDESLIDRAIGDYRSAIACGDRRIVRSCLRGLIGITTNQTVRNRYKRQLDFVNGGQRGPYYSFGDNSDDEPSTPTDLEAIRRYCRQIRRSSIPHERSMLPISQNPVEIWTTLRWLLKRPSPQSLASLDLLLRIEASSTVALESGEASLFVGQLPWEAQATFPPVEVTALLPLPR